MQVVSKFWDDQVEDMDDSISNNHGQEESEFTRVDKVLKEEVEKGQEC